MLVTNSSLNLFSYKFDTLDFMAINLKIFCAYYVKTIFFEKKSSIKFDLFENGYSKKYKQRAKGLVTLFIYFC